MKLAFCLFRYFPYSGLSRVFLNVISEMAIRGHEIDVYVYEWQGEYPDNVNINILPSAKWTNHNRDAAYYKTVRPFLMDGEYDAVIGFNKMPELDFYFAGDFCYADRISAKYGDIYRLTPRHHHFARFEKEVFGVQATTLLLMLSEKEKDIYQNNYATDENRFVILPPALDKSNVITDGFEKVRIQKRKELSVADDQKLILFVGSGFKTKGLDRAIKAFAELPSTIRSGSRFMVVGQDNAETYERLAERLNVSRQIEFTGGRIDVPELMQAADCLLHPAYREAAGNVLLEALASGLPVLTTDGCGYSPHVVKADAGIVLDSPVSQADVNLGLLKILTSPDRKRWIDNGRKYSLTQDLFSMPQFVADYIESKAEHVIKLKSLSKSDYVIHRSASHYLTYMAEFESQQLIELFQDPDSYLERNAKKIIKHDQTTTVAVVECGRKLLVLKRYNTKSAWHFFKRSVRMTRASICWNFAHRLLQCGLMTPQPIGYRENRISELRGRSYYVSVFSEGITLQDYLEGPFDENKVELVSRVITHFFKVMYAQGFAHGDMKASNFLLKDRQLEVLDLDSMRAYQINQFHQHKLFRDKRRFLRNWLNKPDIYSYFLHRLFNPAEINRMSHLHDELDAGDRQIRREAN